MDLETAKTSYITRSRQVIDANEAMARESYGLVEVFSRTKMNGYKAKLGGYYDWLREYDEAYAETLSIHGTINDLQVKQAKAAIAAHARNLFVSSIGNYEKELSNIESSLNFRLTTSIAIIALLVSAIGFV